MRLFEMVKTGSSYLSQSEMPLTFGLGRPDEGKMITLESRLAQGKEGIDPEHQAEPIHNP